MAPLIATPVGVALIKENKEQSSCGCKMDVEMKEFTILNQLSSTKARAREIE